jgi:hypothetical protein
MESFREFEAGPDPFGHTWQVQFHWLLTAISLRHSDSVDVKFGLRHDDTKLSKTVSMRHPDLLELSARTGRPLSDAWCSRLAAECLKHIVETGEDMEKGLITVPIEQLEEANRKLPTRAAA